MNQTGNPLQPQMVPMNGQPVQVVQQQPPQSQVMERYGILDQGFQTGIVMKQRMPSCGEFCTAVFTCNDIGADFNIHDPNRNEMIIHFAEEKASCWCKFCFGPGRQSKTIVYDGTSKETNPMLEFHKEASLCGQGNTFWQICCFHPTLRIKSSEGTYLGKVVIPWFCFIPSADIYNEQDVKEARASGQCSCCGRQDFKLKVAETGQEVGNVSKEWGYVPDTFNVKYFEGTQGAAKARLMGTVFLLNALFFERAK